MKLTVVGSYAKALVMTVERIPAPGETVIGRDYRETYGGKGSDMAVQAARLGADVRYVGAVGDDRYGAEFRELMAAEGVDVTHLRTEGGTPTGVGFIVKDLEGRNVIVVDTGANGSLSSDDVAGAAEVLRDSDVVLAQLEVPLATALDALAVARSAGATTVLNPAPAVDLRDTDLSAVDVLTPNEHEARAALGLDDDDRTPAGDLGRLLLERGPRAVVITRGEAGATVVAAGTEVDVPPADGVDVVDSNGAGDSFNAALSVALGEGRDLLAAVELANVVAALSCEHWETVPSYQGRDTVSAFLARTTAAAATSPHGQIDTKERP